MKASIRHLVLLALMLLAVGLAVAMRPTISLADEREPIELAAMVPGSFGDWRELQDTSGQVVNPQQKDMIDKLYSQTLSRVYVNSMGYRVMLSIAYGKNQSDALQLHKPEICYPAQGFTLLNKAVELFDLQGKPATVVRLQTQLGQRYEPVTYWTVVGDHITKSGIDKKLTEMRYALSREIPDGMLVRVSSIDQAPASAYAAQNDFAAALVASLKPEHRKRFAGDPQLN